MKTVDMGLNMEPEFNKDIEAIRKRMTSKDMLDNFNSRLKDSEDKRDEIIKAVEEHGEVGLNWSCTGENRFNMHACQWAKAMPQYEFEIGRYTCIVRKKA